MDFQTKISRIISAVFHPLLMPTYGVLVMFSSNTFFSLFTLKLKFIIFSIIFLGTFLLPMLFMPFFLYKKYIKKMEMKTRRERILPLVITFASFYLTYYYTNKLLPLPLISRYLLAGTLSVAFSLIVTIYWKISLHLIGVGGLLALATALSFRFSADFRLFYISIFLLAGVVGFARLHLKSHTSLQVYTGFIAGFLIVFSIMFTF